MICKANRRHFWERERDVVNWSDIYTDISFSSASGVLIYVFARWVLSISSYHFIYLTFLSLFTSFLASISPEFFLMSFLSLFTSFTVFHPFQYHFAIHLSSFLPSNLPSFFHPSLLELNLSLFSPLFCFHFFLYFCLIKI